MLLLLPMLLRSAGGNDFCKVEVNDLLESRLLLPLKKWFDPRAVEDPLRNPLEVNCWTYISAMSLPLSIRNERAFGVCFVLRI